MGSQRVVLITGGTAGIGLATARQFVAQGNRVFICSRNPIDPNLFDPDQFGTDTEYKQGNLEHRAFDIGQTERLKEWIRDIGTRLGRIDLLVNNAAYVVKKPFELFTEKELSDSLHVNLFAMLTAIQAAIPFVSRSPRGLFVNISSMAAIDPFPGFSIYGACKSFIELFTKSLSDELNRYNISCYSLRAGAVETDLLRRVLPEFPKEEAIAPQEIAQLISNIANNPEQFSTSEPIEISKSNVISGSRDQT